MEAGGIVAARFGDVDEVVACLHTWKHRQLRLLVQRREVALIHQHGLRNARGASARSPAACELTCFRPAHTTTGSPHE